jgi:hypothetical protein
MARAKVRRIDWSPDEWLSGTRGQLTVRELAVYDVVLNLIYSRGSACPDDAEFVYGHFRHPAGLSRSREVQATRQALDELIQRGKLRVSTTHQGRWLTNGRADIELGRAEGRIESASKAGVASGAARRTKGRLHSGSPSASPRRDPKSSQSNDLARTAVRNHQPPILTDHSTETDTARASRPAPPPAPPRAPDTTPSKPAKPSASDQRLRELATKFHKEHQQ